MLQEIINHKLYEVEELKRSFNTGDALKIIEQLPPVRSMAAALRKPGSITLLAEIKKASPSRGIIREDFNVASIAGIYSESGADAISVLTDVKFFAGRPEYIPQVRETTGLPILRKDFIIDPVQIYQARTLGADAVLLICAALSPEKMRSLLEVARDTGMEVIAEVHNEMEMESALGCGAGIIGINNRDLKTFITDVNTTLGLMEKCKGISQVVISESGIKNRSDMEIIREAGVDGALVGESLMRSQDIAAKVGELRYGNNGHREQDRRRGCETNGGCCFE